jgi:hypothetical protein
MTVESVNGKSGVVSLAAADVEALAESEAGEPNGIATLDSGGTLPEAQLPSSVISSSQAGGDVVLEEVYFGAVGEPATTSRAIELQEALEYANAHNATLVLPNQEVLVDQPIALGNLTNKELRIRRSGSGSVIVDQCTTAPWLTYERTDGKSGRPIFDFTQRLACKKAAHAMIALRELRAAHLDINVTTLGEQESGYECFAAFELISLWEGSFVKSWFQELRGHSIWYDNPEENGGNINFGDMQSDYVSGGIVLKGLSVTNNCSLALSKFVFPSGGTEFYVKQTGSGPAVGATEITLAKGIESKYFAANRCVILYSAAGMDILHLDKENWYNATTGVLKFRDATKKEHNKYEDMRVICCRGWSVITDSFCLALTLDGAHFEQTPAFLHNTTGSAKNVLISISQGSNTGEPRGVYLAGTETDMDFDDCTYSHPVGTATEYAMVCPLGPAPNTTSGLPKFRIRRPRTSPTPNLASMETAEWRPFYSPDGEYTSLSAYPNGIYVETFKGVERNRISASCSYKTSRIVEASVSALQTDDIIYGKTPTANITYTLIGLRGKVVTIKKVDAAAHTVIVKASAGKKIDGAEVVELKNQYESVRIHFDGEEFHIV